MKAVIYARYSSDSQREESIEGQLRECKEYAERNGITVLSTYIDRALSAKTDNRPDFQRMIKDSAKGLFDIVLVWKLDRFARNRYDSAHYKAILKKNGVKVVSAKEAIAEDSTGILLESLLEGYAEFYSVELSEKIENLVIERTRQILFDDKTLDAIADMVLDVQTRENTSLPVLKEQLAQTEHGIQNILNAIQQGIFTPSTKQRLEELEETKERLTVSILQEELQKPHLSKEQILFFLHRFRAIDTTNEEHRQRLIDSFVNAVYVYDDKIILTFNYQDGTETITLDDISGSDLGASAPPDGHYTNTYFFKGGFAVRVWL